MSQTAEGLFADYLPERDGPRPDKDWEVRLAAKEDAWGIAAVVQAREGGDLDEMRAHAGRELAGLLGRDMQRLNGLLKRLSP